MEAGSSCSLSPTTNVADKLIVVASEDFARKTSTSNPHILWKERKPIVCLWRMSPHCCAIVYISFIVGVARYKKVAVATNMPIIYLFTFIIYLLTD